MMKHKVQYTNITIYINNVGLNCYNSNNHGRPNKYLPQKYPNVDEKCEIANLAVADIVFDVFNLTMKAASQTMVEPGQ